MMRQVSTLVMKFLGGFWARISLYSLKRKDRRSCFASLRKLSQPWSRHLVVAHAHQQA